MIRFLTIRRAILAEKSFAASAFWSVFGVVAATVIRLLIDHGAAGVPFVTYFPTVVLIALFLGCRWATLTAVASAIVGNRIFRPELPLYRFETADFIMAGLFFASCFILINIGEILRRLMRDLEDANEREAMLNVELRHRAKNLISIIQSLAVLTHRNSDPDTFLDRFSSRLAAMAKVTDIADSRLSSDREIGLLVANAISPFANESNFVVNGSSWELPSAACMPLALALHELCTNAVKYGALSDASGLVSIGWEIKADGKCLVLDWRESGGPPVSSPSHKGLGTILLRKQNGLEDLKLEYLPDGVQCTIQILAGQNGEKPAPNGSETIS